MRGRPIRAQVFAPEGLFSADPPSPALPMPRAAKVFVIGRNKTGTTSLGQLLSALGYRLGPQSRGVGMLPDWARRDFAPLVAFCRTADAFQDIPFSLDWTYVALDQAFPGAKFILTVRDSPQDWFDSLVRFHTALIGKGRVPTADDLRAHPTREPGALWTAHQLIFGVDETTLYDRATYLEHYRSHIRNVRAYFRHRPDALLVVNPGGPDALRRVCRFLGVEAPAGMAMPHANRSA